MAEPKADSIRCDVPGCGRIATYRTDGKEEKDALGRSSLPKLNVCDHHSNWPFSDDAKAFSLTIAYQSRK